MINALFPEYHRLTISSWLLGNDPMARAPFYTPLEALVSVYAALISRGDAAGPAMVEEAANISGCSRRRAAKLLRLLDGNDLERHLWRREENGLFVLLTSPLATAP